MARKTKAQIEFSVAAEGFKTGIKEDTMYLLYMVEKIVMMD